MNSKISVLVLSWNELETVKKSVERLKKEPHEIWVVDNDSQDGTKEWLKTQKGINIIQLPENMGAAYARNRIIEKFTGDYLLMLDGDIVYIPNSAQALKEALEKLPKDAYCLGIHNESWDGASKWSEANHDWPGIGRIKSHFAIAWTQYGLFKGELVRKYPFPEHKEFGKAGYGYEDDYMNAQMEEKGYKSYHCTRPLYYHDAHKTSQIMGEKKKKESEEKRREVFLKDYPNYVHWADRLKNPHNFNQLQGE
jgi:glycosyltransferase involved in cell wall biosynthesis